MMNVAKIDSELSQALEFSEVLYWSKYYNNQHALKCYSGKAAGASLLAMPELDILAMNRVIGLGLHQHVGSKDILDIIKFFWRAGAKRFFIQLSPYTVQDDLREILKAKGFRYHNNWVKLLREANHHFPAVQSDLKVVNVGKDEEQIYSEIIFECFDWDDDRLKSCLSSTIGMPGYFHYLALYHDMPIAAAAMHVMGKYASMAFAATLEAYRAKGAQSLLLETRITDAVNLGCKYLIAETAEEKPDKPVASYRNMRRLGFEIAYLRENWIFEF